LEVEARCRWRSENSINAATPDPHRLKAVNAIVCTSGALLNNQALQRNSVRDESATIAVQATATPPYFNTLITGHLLGRKIRHESTSAISLTG
jgi:hypothetical protein